MKRILINNYYSGVVSRGIITQMDNLSAFLDEMGVAHRVLRCPRLLRRLPRQGVLFHFFEQLYVPFIGIFYGVVIYPYNSASILAPLHRGSLLVVQDFIQNRRKLPGYSKFSAVLVRLTQCIYGLFRGNVAYPTDEVRRQAAWIQEFRNSKHVMLPNCFARFRQLTPTSGSVAARDYILLCTGKVPSKDLAGALKLFQQTPDLHRYQLVVVGLGGDVSHFSQDAGSAGLTHEECVVLGRISDEALKEWYGKAAIVWVHSRHEGFGRNVAEGALCGSKVVASRIRPFSRQALFDRNIYQYDNSSLEDFQAAIQRAMAAPYHPAGTQNYDEDILRRSILGLVSRD